MESIFDEASFATQIDSEAAGFGGKFKKVGGNLAKGALKAGMGMAAGMMKGNQKQPQ